MVVVQMFFRLNKGFWKLKPGDSDSATTMMCNYFLSCSNVRKRIDYFDTVICTSIYKARGCHWQFPSSLHAEEKPTDRNKYSGSSSAQESQFRKEIIKKKIVWTVAKHVENLLWKVQFIGSLHRYEQLPCFWLCSSGPLPGSHALIGDNFISISTLAKQA